MRRLLVLAIAAAMAAIPVAPSRAAQDLIFGGGAVTGIYYHVALSVCNLVNKYSDGKYNCVARPSIGSVFNVNAVHRGLLDFGVAQSDSNWQATKGKGPWNGKPVTDLRSVFSVHTETVLLVTRADTGITKVADLVGHTVNIGNPGSGQRGNALDVLKLYGINVEHDIKARDLQQNEASRALIDGSIDAFFYTVGNPAQAIEIPAKKVHIRIIPIDSPAVRTFVADKPYYVMTQVPAGIYTGVDKPVETYGVKATVVTSTRLSDEVVRDVTRIVFNHLGELRASYPAFAHLKAADMLRALTAPIDPGAEAYFRRNGLM